MVLYGLLLALILSLFFLFKRKIIIFEIFAIVGISLYSWFFLSNYSLFIAPIAFLISTVIELVSLKTPLNFFGIKYWYNLKHQRYTSRVFILGVYPLEVALGWVILHYLSFFVVFLISSFFDFPYLASILLGGATLVSIDLLLDPVAVGNNAWSWQKGTRYFGIPWQNFLGWFFVGVLISFLVMFLPFSIKDTANQNRLIFLLPIFAYGFCWHLSLFLLKQNRALALLGSLPLTVFSLAALIMGFMR
ncbi:hypothetical protein A3B85_02320 [Candidatus Nomurabacteria bacterium RIFCSPHIGHO2_02_FULL_37_13]|uniref:Carotenoid biosynthesis protein n=1 Tax=Candidatus Nomurabacteria bacterium RIFCSPHIGHO2_02_FULL_37_13 TaxID=1801750 RepID=A0A1F6W6J7_9BACT|nr:MAG: hypothetical protein A3B85_02320 [Candidatus Nomurabacteria bacterium RIFCSPHIGHO2_02_FULL_37_13]